MGVRGGGGGDEVTYTVSLIKQTTVYRAACHVHNS